MVEASQRQGKNVLPHQPCGINFLFSLDPLSNPGFLPNSVYHPPTRAVISPHVPPVVYGLSLAAVSMGGLWRKLTDNYDDKEPVKVYCDSFHCPWDYQLISGAGDVECHDGKCDKHQCCEKKH